MGSNNRITAVEFRAMKARGEKISILTAYDYTTAKALDFAGIDSILVGDSMGMVIYGEDSTLKVTMDDLVRHTQAVAKGTEHAMVIADMPFMSFALPEDALRNAGRLVKEGSADAVKLEGGRERIEAIKLILNCGIPVMGHLGLTPQYIHRLGGYKLQGKTAKAAERLLEDALLLEKAGVFSIVLEMVPQQIAKVISEQLSIPTIGIGAGIGCDGQVLVVQDMMGASSGKSFKFVKKYADLWNTRVSAVKEYIQDVRKSAFPTESHSFNLDDEEWKQFQEYLSQKKT
ncbi:MAG: 3-methyl-2-oxobutanoate hydroxymethyltransferase [Promethearchaeota archaeon]